jgi:hypothetical protein
LNQALIALEADGTGIANEVAFSFFAPPTYATGIGSNFVLGNNGRIRWNGANSISVNGQIAFQVTLEQFVGGSWNFNNILNLSQLPDNLQYQVGFGCSMRVTDQNGGATPNAMNAYDFCISQASSFTTSTVSPSLYGIFTFNTNMRSGDEMGLFFTANAWFNTLTSYRVFIENSLAGGSGSGIQLQVVEMPF